MSKQIEYITLEDLFEGEDLKNSINKDSIGKIGLEFPNSSIEIIDMYNTDVPGIWQIFARDPDSNILIIATWDLTTDREVSMYQFRCDSDRPQDLFLQSSRQKEITIKQKYNNETKEIKINKGEYNYIL